MKNQEVIKVLEESLDGLTRVYKSFIQEGKPENAIKSLRLIKDAMKIIDEFSDEIVKVPETQIINISNVTVSSKDPNKFAEELIRKIQVENSNKSKILR